MARPSRTMRRRRGSTTTAFSRLRSNQSASSRAPAGAARTPTTALPGHPAPRLSLSDVSAQTTRVSHIEVTHASRSRRFEIRSRIRQQGHRRRRLRIAARSVFARDAVMAYLKKQFHDVPSVHMAYIAAILARAGHDVKWTRGELVDGDVALVLSSLVDHKNETAWADRMRARGVKVGFIGITASKMPELFAGSLRLHPQRRAGRRRHAPGAGRDPAGHRRQRADRRSRLAAVPALGSGHRRARLEVRHQVVVASGRRRLSAAREPRLPRVLHLLSAPHPRRLPRALDREHRRRDGAAVRPVSSGRTSSSATRCSPSSASASSSCATRSRGAA